MARGRRGMIGKLLQTVGKALGGSSSGSSRKRSKSKGGGKKGLLKKLLG